MQFTSTRVAAALALAFGILGSTTSHAVRPTPISEGTETFKPVWTPLGLSTQPVTVVVQLAGPSVAECDTRPKRFRHAELLAERTRRRRATDPPPFNDETVL